MEDAHSHEPSHSDPPPITEAAPISQRDKDARLWAMCIHLGLLAGFVIPVAGWVVPIVLWQIKKDEFPEVDEHGRIAVNWMISSFIYTGVCVLLIFVLIGIPMIAALGIAMIVFPVIGGIKANNGEVWPYPLSLRIF